MLHFISGDFGPFQAGIPQQVPIWLAIMLKQLHKCRILPPDWLTIENLTMRLEEEIRSDVFEPLAFHYMEISSLLLKHAAEDIEQVEHIRSLLEDLQNVRQDKIRSGLCKISNDVQSGGTAYAIQMNNIAALEINSVRRLMTNSLQLFHKMKQLGASDGTEQEETQSSQLPFSNSSLETPPVHRLRRFRQN